MPPPSIARQGRPLDVVTGAFSFTGRFITRRLLAEGRQVRTLTGHPGRAHDLGEAVSVAPLAFDDPAALTRSLRGAEVLYNTYWVRFPHRRTTFDQAVANTEVLVRSAKLAGIRRVVHISITNPASDSPFAYFRGKAAAERAVIESGLSHAIIRPTVVFGEGDILINNIAWLARRFPVFAVPGRGDAPVRPIHVDDVARIAVEAGHRSESLTVDAVGPETFTFEELVRLVAGAVGRRTRVVRVPPAVVLGLVRVLGFSVRDVLLTGDELGGLLAGLVSTGGPATGEIRLSQWLEQHADEVGRSYASELTRHYR
jgi:uncharacterized protein YbjT (DUF2867 family)